MNSSTKQLSFIFILFAFILSLSIMTMEDLFFEQSAQKVALENGKNKVKEREGVVKAFLEHSKENLLSIRESIFFNNYLKDKSNKKLLEDIFLTYAKSHSDFMQIRYHNVTVFYR